MTYTYKKEDTNKNPVIKSREWLHREQCTIFEESDSFMNFIDRFIVSCERMDLFMTLTKKISEMYSETGFSREIAEYENILAAITIGYKD